MPLKQPKLKKEKNEKREIKQNAEDLLLLCSVFPCDFQTFAVAFGNVVSVVLDKSNETGLKHTIVLCVCCER